MSIKFKLAYTVYIDEQEIGCIQNKKEFEKLLKGNLYKNEEENIAFSEINGQVKYKVKLLQKDISTTEDQTLLAIKEKADITYIEYAVNAKGKEREHVKTIEEAKEICNNIIQELGEDADVSVSKVYTKNYSVNEQVDIATVTNKIIEQVKEEKKREDSTINGIYIAVTPVQGHITSRYGSIESVRGHAHQGLDIAAQTGTKIKAVADGTVTFAGEKGGYGKLVIIDHGNGIETYYGHCSELYAKVGKKVIAGDIIAAVGNTGNSTGSHLHFELRKDGKYVNPQHYLYN